MGDKSIRIPHAAFCFLFRFAQPERDMRWLHRLLHHGQQLIVQLVQVHLLAQCSTEGGHDLGCVILAAIEAPINDSLDTAAQGLEEGGYNQRRADEHQRLNALPAEKPGQAFQSNDQAGINRS